MTPFSPLLDGESGLYYNRARYYHPTLGRFVQRDPLGYVDGGSLYQYVTGNPLGWNDPYGLARTFDDPNAKEHKKGARGSTQEDHERGRTRVRRDKGGEKGDARRPYSRGGRSTRSRGFILDDGTSFRLTGRGAGTAAGGAAASIGIGIIIWEIEAMFNARQEAWDAIADAERAGDEANAANVALFEALSKKWAEEEADRARDRCREAGDFYLLPEALA